MGIFDRKQPIRSNKERIEFCVKEMKDMMEKDNTINAIFIVGTAGVGSSLVQGDAQQLENMLIATAEKNSHFNTLIRFTGRKLPESDLEKKVKDKFEGLFDKMKGRSSDVVDLGDGKRALAIKTDDIDNMSDDDVDKIVNGILGDMGIDGSDDDNDSEG